MDDGLRNLELRGRNGNEDGITVLAGGGVNELSCYENYEKLFELPMRELNSIFEVSLRYRCQS